MVCFSLIMSAVTVTLNDTSFSGLHFYMKMFYNISEKEYLLGIYNTHLLDT